MSKALLEDIYPLSPLQQGMLFHALIALEASPEADVYVRQISYGIAAPLDVAAFERAWQAVMDRHAALRTSFVWEGRDEPQQVVFRKVRLAFEHHDWRGLEPAEQERRVEELLAADRARPFRLSRAPLLRVTLAQLAPDRFRCAWTYHHLLLDGWSAVRVMGEVAELYRAFAQGRDADLPPSRPYGDYIAWLRKQDPAEIETFWRRELAGFSEPTPVDLGPGLPAGEAGLLDRMIQVPADVTSHLRGRLGRQGLTFSTLVYGAWALLLSRCSGREDVLFGAVFSGRPESLADAESIVGLLVNTLPVRVRVEDAERLWPWLRRLQEQRLRLHRVEHSPLAEVQRWSEVPGGVPLFDTLVIFENFPRSPDGDSGGNGVSDVRTLEATSYPLTLLAEASGELYLRAAWDTGRFAPAAVERLLGRLETLLRAVAEDPDRRLEDLPVLTAAERQQLLGGWNDTAVPMTEAPVHRLFEEQAARRPDAVAVALDGERLTYAELNRLANRLAHRLRALGVGPETLAGVYAESAPETVAGLLGVLKAGGAYVPLDPDYPRERLAYMVEDSRLSLLLTQRRLLEHLPAKGLETVLLDDPEIAGWSAEDPGVETPPAGLAYVIYTSGSTGRPKGVQVAHAGLTNFLLSMAERPGLAAGERLLAVTPLSFDIAGLELYLPLVTGAEVRLVRREVARDGTRLLAALREQGIDAMQATPSTWQLLVEAGWQPGEKTLRALCGGEALPAPLAQALEERAASVWNLYGPTETTVWSAVHPVKGSVALGRPIANTALYLLDPQLRLVPLGAPGELCIGGAGLARGYLGRAGLTADRFAPDPFGAPGARLYRTGDLARLREDGRLEFLGRLDHQIKIRGFRIELGEIEAALARLPGVREAVVLARDQARDQGTDRRLVAYLAGEPAEIPEPGELRARLRERLPEPMVPAAVVVLPALPRTPNGKIDRRALPEPRTEDRGAAAVRAEPRTEVERTIARVWGEVLGLEKVGVEEGFFDLGGHSLLLMRVRNRLKEALERPIELVDLFRFPTVASLARYLAPELAPEPDPEPAAEPARESRRAGVRRRARETDDAIAVIGLAGRFPGARNVDELWANLREGVEAITFFTDEELTDAGVPEALLRDPGYVRAKGFLEEAEHFDAAFFGFLPRDAELMDPQHRVFLESAWEALETAGYDPGSYAGAIGVYAGASLNSYWMNLPAMGAAGTYQAIISNDKDFLATRLSYKLNLRGPSVGVQTACSTSLVAVHMAAQSLLYGECDIALAGGVSVTYPRKVGYVHTEGMIASPDGHCRAFDERAQGTVFGEGVGVVVLKRLAEAVEDGDTIRAVIRGSAINNDGSLKISYTAPSVEGQAQAIAEALEIAGVDPATVTYVEAHGTGTPLGDPIEVAALSQAFRSRTDRTGFCALGSLKASVGHLDAAAGVAGLIKTVLCLERAALPPSLHFERPNPQIDFANSPFFVNAELREWRTDGGPRRAGVSSFGIGGTNAHVVLEEAPAPVPAVSADTGEHLLVLSARTATALERMTDRLAGFLDAHPEVPLADVAWTLQVGRRPFEHRRFLVCRDAEDAGAALEARQPGRVSTGVWEGSERPVVALFPGQGAQRTGMALDLYRGDETFRAEIDRCAALLEPHLGTDLRRLLWPDPLAGTPAEAEERLRRTAFAQPALFAVEYALAATVRAWGIRPRAMIGHSVGEYVAACLAGVLALEDALALVAARGRLMQELPGGSMLDVALGEAEVRALLGDELSLAAVNAPRRCVVSGPSEAVDTLERQLKERGVVAKRVRTSHAFHSRLMDPILDAFRRLVEKVRLSAPRLPFLSNVTGTWIRDDEATDPGYWVRHLRQEVRFADGLREILAREPEGVLLELGPGETLTAILRQQPEAAGRVAFSALPMPRTGGSPPLQETLGRLWLAGVPVDWEARGRRGRRVPLPTYPFERQRYALEPPRRRARPVEEAVAVPVPAPLPVQAPAPTARTTRRERILEILHGVVRGLSGLSPEQIDPRASFLEMGVDSLLLIQFTEAVQEKLGVQLSLTRLLEEINTLEALVGHLDRELPVDALGGIDSEGPAPEPVPVPLPILPARTEEVYVPYQPLQPLQTAAGDELAPRQQRALAQLIERYTARTRESKRRTDAQRPVLADNRASVDFRLQWKEMVYPIIGERSAGSRLWDVDGNEYIDLAMGFGVHLFGHSPAFLQEALQEQLAKGFQLGPQTELAGEVAAGIAELTGVERVTFSNTGTEAVMTAMRLARAVTGRSKIALFAGSYHGSFDGVLARGRSGGDARPIPMAPGVLPHLVDDVLVLPYGDPAAFDVLRAAGADLAAVLVEPVQSRRPELQPGEFLRELREVTRKIGAALIFDEVITGFRVHPGGCQAWFGVQADLVTYGKVIGGGMPIGVVGGRADYIDTIDGGVWRFGDGSYPATNKTFFAGTFCKHPLAMAAARAVLRRFREEPGLQEGLNRRTAELAGRLNAWFERARMPLQVASFGSLFRIALPPALRHGLLFFYYLAERGVFTWEGRTCFLSTATTAEDVERIVAAVQDSALAMRDGGFLPESGDGGGRPLPVAAPAPPPAPSPAPEVVRTLPATDGQRQLWIFAQMGDAANRAYNLAKALRLRGRLRAGTLRWALQQVTERHEALRTAFSADGETRFILSGVEAPWLHADLSGLGEDARETALAALLREEGRHGFDLLRAPLFRAVLVQSGADDWRLLLTCHHTIVDGRSLGVLLAELEAFYAAAPSGRAPDLPPPVSETGTAAASEPGPGALDYWLSRFQGPPPQLDLPADRGRPARPSYRGGLQAVAGAERFLADLRSAGARSGSTLFMVLLGAYGALLHRLSGQEDFVVGVPSGEAESGGPSLGYRLHLLPLRLAIDPEQPFADFLRELRGNVLEGQRHRDFSFNRLLHALGLRAGAGRPLVAAVFNLDRGRTDARFAGLDLAFATIETGGAKFEISLNVTDRGRDLLLESEHALDLVSAETMRRWLGHYLTLLEAVARDPRQPVAGLPLLSEVERHQALVAWNDTAAPPPAGHTVHERFAAQTRATPAAWAAACGDERLTFRELDERANRLARALRRLGVGPEARVGLCLPRSVDQVAAVLAVLKAGGAYVPLDPAAPRERLAYQLADCGAAVLVTRADLAIDPDRAGARVLRLDRDAGEIGRESPAAPPDEVAPDNLAYVIYTSGSTGRPKGVMIRHASLLNLAAGLHERIYAGLGRPLVVSVNAPLAFDASVKQLLQLLSGHCVHVLPEEVRADGAALLGYVRHHGIDVLDCTPAQLQLLLAARDGAALPGCLLVGGEGIDEPAWAALAAARARSFNVYGPTEATVDATVWAVKSSPDRPVIGRPIRNVELRVLDRRLRLVPAGVIGELAIGGAGLARGYLERPDLTAERFVPDPYGAGGARLYRSGDLARLLPDGRIECLGRADHQVKVRGFRIEPAEIETALAEHPEIAAAAVVAPAAPDGGRRLVAYLVQAAGEPLASRELRAFLRERLPEYMIPAAFTALDALPLTPNGKVDRRALAAAEATFEAADFAAPRDLVEELVADVWSSLLGVERVGIHDSFFDLGGHSLLATRVISRLREALGVELPIADLFTAPTVAELAARVAVARRGEMGAALAPPLAAVPREPGEPQPLSFAQQRLWVIDQIDPGTPVYNIPTALRLAGPLDPAALAAAFSEVLRRHEVLRARFVLAADEPRQAFAPAAPLALPVADLSGLPPALREAEAHRLAAREAQRPFDLERGPVFRAGLLRLSMAAGAEEHAVLVTLHHIASDGWSKEILFGEVGVLYEAFSQGRPSPLPELPIQYADFAVWQRSWLRGEVLEAQLAYWRQALGASSPVLAMPTDRPRPAVQSTRGAVQRLGVSRELTDALQALARREGGTLFMVLLAAWQVLLSRYSGQEEIRVGTPIAGRNRVEVEGLIGVFTNTLVLRAEVRGELGFRDLLARVREGALAAHSHQDLPFEKLVAELQPERVMDHTPLFQAMFVMNPVSQVAGLPGISASALAAVTETAKFDLNLELTETRSGLAGTLEFAADLFDRSTVQRLIAHLESLLAAVAADPGRPLARIGLLSSAERWQFVQEWNDTALPYGRERLIHQLFEAQAERQPDAVAAVFQGERLSYGELNRRANQLAHHLQFAGAGRGSLVAVYLPRSLEMIVAVLGILKAGAAYVPLASSFPLARRQWILSTLGVRCLVTHASRLDEMAELAREVPTLDHLICADGAVPAEKPGLRGFQRLWTAADLAKMPRGNPAAAAAADETAYIIFTSGSTGTPKGVEVRHRPVINLIEWVNREFQVSAADRVLFITALSFDLSVYDIFGLLAAGGSIHIASDTDLQEPDRLFQILCREPVTFWDSAPAALQQLSPYFADGKAAAAASRLRLVFLSGDWIPVGLPDAVRGTFRRARVVSLGGATEATVWSNFFPIGEVDPRWVSIPYGRPIQNARYHVLDGELEPCPVGIAGDLFIGGECLASGYAAEPALTAHKFIPDPWGAEPGARLYRTGDRARFWRSGVMEFLGRLDHQVKVRGFRIELGEIEANLVQHPGVRAAVALVREDRPGQRRIVAYVVPAYVVPVGQPAPEAAELLAFLGDRLPEYMLPAAFVALDGLPVTPNGKLDRAALPAPGEAAAAPETFAAPGTPEEKLLAGIWAELLGRERIGIHDRFLEIGGDSILSIQVVARANRAGLRITPRQLYEHQTIAALAAVAAVAEAGPAGDQGLVTGEVPLGPSQRWLLEQDLADLHHFNQSVLLASRRPLGPALLDAAFARLLEHHDALRLRLTREDGEWRQRIAEPEPGAPFHRIDLSGLPPAAVSPAVEAGAAAVQGSLDLAAGPVLRAVVFQTAPEERGRLLIVIHHWVIDGVSWRILLEDLQAAYEALERGEAVALPAKTASYKRWAERPRERAAAELAAARPLPVDLDGDDTVAAVRAVEVALDAEETRALLQEVPPVYRTGIDDALLTALAQAVAEWTGEDGMVVDVEGHGRDLRDGAVDLDLSRTVGWFTAIEPVVLRLGGTAEPGEALCRVKEQLRARACQGRAEISFNYLGQLDQALRADSPFAAAPESAGPEQSPRQRRRYRIAVNGAVAGGRLRLSFSYGSRVYRPETIAALADAFAEALRALIRHCQSPAAGGFTASDFPLARLDAERTRHLAARLPAREVEDLYPLSPLQESLLFHSLSARDSQAGVEQLCCTLHGALDLAAFERTWNRVVERHPILRTLFLVEGLDRPLQAVLRPTAVPAVPVVPVGVEDWRGQPEAEQDARLESFLHADRERGFALDRAPLMRLTLVRFGEDAWQLVWTHHHLVLDGWCRALVLEEVFRLYAGFRRGRRGEEAALPVRRPFRDYIAWLDRQDPAEAEAFWRRSFAGFTGPHPLRIDRLPDRARGEGAHGTAAARLPEEATARLRAFAQRHGVTLSTLTQAAWALLLSRYSGSEDVVFGAAVSGRPPDLPGVEAMVGMFVNNLPVRVRVPGAEPLLPWLRRFQDWQQELRLFEHSALPQVQEWSGAPLGRRLFDTLVVFQNYPVERSREESGSAGVGLALHSASLETNYPLTLVVDPGTSLALELVYHHRWFDAAGAERILGHLLTLLDTMSAAPEASLGTLPLLPPAGRARDFAAAALPSGDDVLAATPTQLQNRLAGGWQDGVRAIVCRGEVLPRGLADRLLERCPDVWSVFDEEEGRWSAVRRVEAGSGPVLLGAGDFAVLDRNLQPLPAGIPGDLWAGGEWAGGEWSGGEAPVRTGLAARRLPDGGIEVLRSADEEGEIEALLFRHPDVLGAAVGVRADSAGEPHLVAWIAAAPGRAVDAAALGAWLRETLPERMVPSVFLSVDTLPPAADGRLDRSALPSMDDAGSLQRSYVPARNSLELEIVRIWEDVFGVKPIGVRDSFFDLGGHSLLAIRLMAHVRERFGRDLPLAILFERPTVEHLAAALRQSGDAAWSPLVVLQEGGQAGGSRPPLFLIHPSGGGVLGYLELARRLGPGQPVYGLQAPGQLRGQQPIGRLEDMAAFYVDVVRSVQPAGPYRLGGSSFGGYAAFEMARQLREAGERVALVALLDTYVPNRETRPDPLEYLDVVVKELLPQLAADLPRGRSLDEQLAWVLAALRARDRLPLDFGSEDLRRYFDVYWTHVTSAHDHEPVPGAARVTLFRATDSPDFALQLAKDPTLGWGALALDGVEIHDVPGNHFNLTAQPHVRVLAERLRGCLDRELDRDPGRAGKDGAAGILTVRSPYTEEKDE